MRQAAALRLWRCINLPRMSSSYILRVLCLAVDVLGSGTVSNTNCWSLLKRIHSSVSNKECARLTQTLPFITPRSRPPLCPTHVRLRKNFVKHWLPIEVRRVDSMRTRLR
ncbi:hypothetical protein DFS33DRAFT_1368221 [Desarmillaria ectypa]|nr:hypothetical protein DFS33DRAFT_1368221 [Desarmillaria ectypa]